MEIRKIKPEENITSMKVQYLAFLASLDLSSAESNPEKYEKGYEKVRAVFNDEEKMCARMELVPFQIRFGGHNANMTGVAEVATLPEERRKGYIKKLFHSCFEEMYEEGQIFSYLYPFSNSYYRQFGYEVSLNLQRCTIPLSAFSSFPMSGRVELYEHADDSNANRDIKYIYESFIQDKNLALVRDKVQWDRWLKRDSYKDNYYTYLWYNDNNEPKGYIIFEVKRNTGAKADMLVNELAWLDSSSLLGIFGFMNRFSTQLGNFLWNAPTCINPHGFFPECGSVKREIIASGMNRIINLKEALKLMFCPEEPGEAVIEVKDSFLDWNNGIYRMSWSKGNVEVERTSKAADISCSIQAMTQLITGFAPIEELIFRNDIEIHKNYSSLSKLFKKRSQYLIEKF